MVTTLDTKIIVPWLVLDLTGQWALLGLLITFAIVKHLPQRRNPFLVNFLLTTFLGSIPPALLLYTGHQYSYKPSTGLCFAQAALVDGVGPLFAVAQVALVFDTWAELRGLYFNKRQMSRTIFMKYLLVFAPYVAMWIWTFASFVAAAQSHAKHDPGYVYCRNSSTASETLRNYLSVFVLVFIIIEIALELGICWILYSVRGKTLKDPTAWRTTKHFAVRLLILSLLQFITLVLTAANPGINSYGVKIAYELLTSMNPLVTFLAFATQRSVFQAWKFWGKKKPDITNEQQPQGGSVADWVDVGPQPHMQIDEEAFEHKPADPYFKAWLRVGENEKMDRL